MILPPSGITVEARPLTSPVEPRTKSSLHIPESFDEIGLRLSNEFAPVIEKDADTLVYIGVPPPTPGQDPYEYDYMERLFRRPYLMKSATLQAVGSSKFAKYLGPMSARTARKLKKLEVHKSVMQPDSIKYYVDASPALNDDEALIQLTELTVPQGALKWHQLAKTLGIPESHVGGRDELNVPARPTYAPLVPKDFSEEDQMADTGNKLDANNEKGVKVGVHDSKERSPPPPPVVDLPLEEEYTALRHHTATARLFQALAGNDPKLNSAAKAWTFCMLAKYFDCAHSPVVSHWIVSWLLENSNSHFIQNNPEIAYRMAIATQSTWLIRCTFAMLVGQQAMVEGANEAISSTSGQPETRRTYRTASCLDDDDINRIDHAASALTRRIREVLEEVAVFPGIWNESSLTREIARLNRLPICSAHPTLLQKVKDKFRDYVRRMIYMTLSPAYDLKSVGSIGPFKGFGNFTTYTDIPQPLRLLTQHFWNILRLEQFARDYTDTGENHEIWEQTQAGLKQQRIITGTDIPYVSRKELFAALDKLNEYLVSPVGRLQGQAEPNRRQGTPETSSPAKKLKVSPKEKDWCCLQCGAEYDEKSILHRVDVVRGDLHCVVCGTVLIQDEAAKQEREGHTKTRHATQHHGSTSWDMEPLLRKLNDSSLRPEAVPQKPISPATDLSGGVASVADVVDDWQDAMADIHPLGGSFLKSLSIRQKSMAAPQLTVATSGGTPFGTMGQHTGPGAAITSASGASQSEQDSLPLMSAKTTDVLGGAQGSLAHVLGDSPVTRSKLTGTMGTMGTMTEKHPLPPGNASALYDGPSYDISDYAVAPTSSKAQHTEALQPNEVLAVDISEDDYPSANAASPSRFDRRRTSSMVMANDNDDSQPMHEPARHRVAFDPFVHAGPTPVSQFPEQLEPQHMRWVNTTRTPIAAILRPIVQPVLLDEIGKNLYSRLSSIVTPGYVLDGTCDFDIPNGEISTLLCLNDNEWKYLPLWAGGLDDGTGGVFNDGVEVPDAPDVEDGGFRGGAMGIIPGVGSSIGGSMNGDGSEFEEILTEVGISTVGKASRIATDGTATETVISLDE